MQVAELQAQVVGLQFDRSKWKPVRFDQMAQCVTDRVDNPSEAGVDRYVGLEHLDPRSLKLARWGSPSDVEATKLRFKPGDIIFGKRRAYQRKLAVADFEGICSAHSMVLRAREDAVVPGYLPVFMQSEYFFETALRISVGGLSPTINWRELARQEFLLPPESDQQRIADVLWATETSQLKYRAAVVLLATAFESKLESHFGGKGRPKSLIEICGPDGIRIGPFGSQLHAHDYVESGVGVVMPYNMERDGIVETNLAFITEDKASELSRHRLLPGDILLPRRGDLSKRGYVTSAEEGWICGTGSIRIRVPAPYSSRAIYYCLLTSAAQSWLSDNAVGTTMPNLNQKIVASLPIYIEDPDVAASAALELDEFLSAKAALIKHTERLSGLQEGLRRAIYVGAK